MTQLIYSLSELNQAIQAGQQFKYLCFWGHSQSGTQVDKSCFSQWFSAGFELEGLHYATAEHYMMAEKARLFNDHVSVTAILQSPSAAEAKKLGRSVQGYDDQLWLKHRFEIVVRGNLAKFGQNPALKAFLLGTAPRVLVEASPVDAIWGIGLVQDNPKAVQPEHWQGLNLLGFALMKVRDTLQAE